MFPTSLMGDPGFEPSILKHNIFLTSFANIVESSISIYQPLTLTTLVYLVRSKPELSNLGTEPKLDASPLQPSKTPISTALCNFLKFLWFWDKLSQWDGWLEEQEPGNI